MNIKIKNYIKCLCRIKDMYIKENRIYSWIIILFSFMFLIVFIGNVKQKAIIKKKNYVIQKNNEIIKAQHNFINLAGVGGGEKYKGADDYNSLNVEHLVNNYNIARYRKRFDRFGYPVKFPEKTYVWRWDCEFTFRSYDNLFHPAFDFVYIAGVELISIDDGTVDQIGYDKFFGNWIIIKHSDNWYSRFCHLSFINNDMVMGYHVNKGQVIGDIGSTGQGIGVHCHLEIYQIINGIKCYYNYFYNSLHSGRYFSEYKRK